MNHPFYSLLNSFEAFLKTSMQAEETNLLQILYDYNTDLKRKEFGDLSCNAPLLLAKTYKRAPLVIAQEIASTFTHEHLKEIKIALPGFLNFILHTEIYTAYLSTLQNAPKNFLTGRTQKPLSYNIEFVSANPTGPLHIGHGRGGIIGDVLGRVLKMRGHMVAAEFYINDAGAQIEKLGLSLKARCNQLSQKSMDFPENGYHGEYLLEIAHDLLAQHGNDICEKETTFFASYAKHVLLTRIQKTLANYNIAYDTWFSEKTLHESNAIEAAIEKIEKNGYTYHHEGALWFASTRFGDDKDRVIKRANGEWTYVAADIAYLENKINRGFEKLVMILGQDHHSYLIRLKAATAALGYNPDQLDIILYQLVTLKEGDAVLRLSKRAGKIISLDDVIQTAGPDVARFFYLNRKADAHLDFDLDLALQNTHNNPVYYIQYAYVRISSILKKATALSYTDENSHTYLYDDLERMVFRKIMALEHVCQAIEKTYHTHALAYYAYELASLFHALYEKSIFIDKENANATHARISLARALHRTFEVVFDMLGISKPAEM